MKTNIKNLFLALALLAGIHQAAAQTSFLLSSNYTVGNQPYSVAVFKNVNGKMDMVCGNNGDGTLTLLTNNGSGIFTTNATYTAVGNNPGHVVAFTNVGGVINLASANANSGSLTIFTNNGSGGFGFKTNINTLVFPDSVAAADINYDGKVDLICVNGGSDDLEVFTNNGNGGFVFSCHNSTGSGPHTVVVADVNNDSKLDLMCINTGDTVSVLTNNGIGIFTQSGTNFPSGGSSAQEGFAAADVNGDGYVDLITANIGAGSISVLTNNGNGTFASPTNYFFGNTTSIAAFTNVDGKVDLACGVGNTIIVLTNNGSGIFTPACTNIVGYYPYITAADVNGDGKVDLICANSGGNTVSVVFNTTPFTTSVSLTNIVVSPATPTIVASSNQQFIATGYYNNGSTQILTSNLTWSSSSPAVATINTNGLATGLTAGTTIIKALSGSVSNSAVLTVVSFPTITVQPTNNTVPPNGVSLNVTATGGGLSYQWQLNGTNITGATGSTLPISNVTLTNFGVYTVIISNLVGTVTSQAAIVSLADLKMFAGFFVYGPIGTNYVIQSKSNLTNAWTTRTNLTLPSQPYIYIDYNSPTNPQQFYQAMPQ